MTRRMLMKTALIVGLLALPGLAFAGGNKALHGSWKAKSMIMGKTEKSAAQMGINVVVSFSRGGKFSASMKMGKNSQTERGTWTTKGNKLITTTVKSGGKGKTESATYKVKGNTLMIISKGMTLKFVRVKAKKR